MISEIVLKVWWRERYPPVWLANSMPSLGSAHLILVLRCSVSHISGWETFHFKYCSEISRQESNLLAFWRCNSVWVFLWHSAELLNGSTKNPCGKIGLHSVYHNIYLPAWPLVKTSETGGATDLAEIYKRISPELWGGAGLPRTFCGLNSVRKMCGDWESSLCFL